MEAQEKFKHHMDKFRHGLFKASLDYYMETGTVSGSLFLEAKEMFPPQFQQPQVSAVETFLDSMVTKMEVVVFPYKGTMFTLIKDEHLQNIHKGRSELLKELREAVEKKYSERATWDFDASKLQGRDEFFNEVLTIIDSLEK